MLRSLIYHWRMNLAVLAAAAVATAVLTGALVVGDSVRQSLRDLTLDRLGRIDLALVGNRFVGRRAVEDLAQRPAVLQRFSRVVPAAVTQGTVIHADSRARASGVNLYGVEAAFAGLFPDLGEAAVAPPDSASGLTGVVVNEALRRELGAEAGDPLLVSFERSSEIPRETLLGRKEPTDVVGTLRLSLTGVLPNRGPGRLSLSPHQRLPFNAFVPLERLQRALDRRREINAIFVAGRSDLPNASDRSELQKHLRDSLTLEDLGMGLTTTAAGAVVESTEFVLAPEVAEAVRQVALEVGATSLPVLTYLANSMGVGERRLPYSTAAALELPVPEEFGELSLAGGAQLEGLGADEILLDAWAAEDLAAEVGDEVEMTYYVIGAGDALATESATFRMAGVVAMTGLAVDPGLTPVLPGVSDADNMGDWDPPFPVDLSLIRPRDEAYWDRYRAAPKAFVALKTGQRLWSSRFGRLTSVRLALPQTAPDVGEAALERRLREAVDLEGLGLAFRPVKEDGLEAAQGATDFAGLFLGFSLFLIAASALLVGLLFGLGVEQRAQELGLLLAVGYRVRRVRARLLGEGAVLSILGAAAGSGLAVLYARWLVGRLQGWWAPLLDSPFLSAHVRWASLVLGGAIALVVVLASIIWAIRRLSSLPVRQLLAGSTHGEDVARRGRWAPRVAWSGLGLAAALTLVGLLMDVDSSPALFFAVGAALLIAGLAFFALWCRRSRGGLARREAAVVGAMASRNSARNPGRSLLSVALVASACFVLVAVAANRHRAGGEVRSKDSGSGGFTLVAETDVALRQDLNRREDLRDLGFPDAAAEKLAGCRFYALRLRPGEDVSCLNLYQPQRPRLLGVPRELIRRGGFHFRDALEEAENPWTLLQEELEDGVVPAIGDYNSVRWILHLGLGQEMEMENERGETVRLRIVGLLEKSIFQSELLISEANFLHHFPSQGGFAYFLAETPGDGREITTTLEENLGRYGFDATGTADKLAAYQAVENTYLATFQVLGGLGLLLGTVGLGVVLVRNVIERRAELATLRAFGFRRRILSWMVVVENGVLLLVGILVGSLAGLIAVAPHLAAGAVAVPWGYLATTLALVVVVGMIASLVGVLVTLRAPLLPVLKTE